MALWMDSWMDVMDFTGGRYGWLYGWTLWTLGVGDMDGCMDDVDGCIGAFLHELHARSTRIAYTDALHIQVKRTCQMDWVHGCIKWMGDMDDMDG